MSLPDDLQKLEDLRRGGTLSEAEFRQAKALLLAGGSGSGDEPLGRPLSDQLAEVRHQNELARIDREWEIERQQYLVADRYGRRHVPTSGMGLATAVLGGLFGAFWLVMAVSITGGAPNEGPFVIAKVVFPLFGVLFIAAVVVWGIHCHTRAQEYDAAFRAYRERRGRVGP